MTSTFSKDLQTDMRISEVSKRVYKLEDDLGKAYAKMNAMQEEIERMEKELKKKIKKVKAKVKQDDVYRG